MTQDQLQQAILQAMTSGQLQPAQIIMGDYVQHKIDKVESGGIGVQEVHYHNGQEGEGARGQEGESSCATANDADASAREGEVVRGANENHHLCFAQAVNEIQGQPHSDGRPFIRAVRDHVALEHLAAELGIISAANQHGEYIQYLRQMSEQGMVFTHQPSSASSLSAYVNYIDSSHPEQWTHTTQLDQATFSRYLTLAQRVRTTYHRRYVLS